MLQELYIIIIFVLIAITLWTMISLLFDILKPLIRILIKGIIWLFSLVIEYILFEIIFFVIYGEDKKIFTYVAIIVLNIFLICKKHGNKIGSNGSKLKNAIKDKIYSKRCYRKSKRTIKRKANVPQPPSYDYVLNKNTGVIHRRWDESAKTIKEEHRVEISSSTAKELVQSGKNYRYKQ